MSDRSDKNPSASGSDLPSPRVRVSRKLESEAELGFNPKHSDVLRLGASVPSGS